MSNMECPLPKCLTRSKMIKKLFEIRFSSYIMNNIFFIAILLLFSINANAQNPSLPNGFAQSLIADSLNPTAMAFDHHGNLFLAQKDGRILWLGEDGDLSPDPVLTIPVDDFNERGLAGIALHPDWDNQPWLYAYYTVRDSNFNRLSRFMINGNLAVPGSEEVLFEFDKLNSGIHNGGSLQFGNDGKLYIGTGDGGKSSNAQSLALTLGKVIRLNPDGSIPSDNPFYLELNGKNRAVYAYGLRNPFSMAIEPGTGRIFVSEVGQGNYEEVNEILPHLNYGWSQVEGPNGAQNPPLNYQDPLFAYPHAQGCAIVGAAIYAPDQVSFPVNYVGKYFFADYCRGVVKLLDLSTGIANDTFATGLKQPVAFAVNPHDGSLWYLMRSGIGGGSVSDNTSSSNGTLWKVFYTGSGAPFVSVPPQDVLLSVGESANFEVQVLGKTPMHFRWQKDGVDLLGSDSSALYFPNASLTDNGTKFRCIASNAEGADTSATAMLGVTVNQRPQPEIIAPALAQHYKAGLIIHFQGIASDPEEGVLAAANLQWRVDFHHDSHTHPALAPIAGISEGSFTIPLVGETSTNTWYRIHLSARDQEGLEKSDWRDVFPKLTTVLVEGPTGMLVNVDGIVRPMPYTFSSLQGQQRLVQAFDKIILQDTIYLFEKWAESADSSLLLAFSAPDTPGLTLHPLYSAFVLGNGTGLHGEYFIDPEFDLDEDPVTLRLDTVINFNWGNDSPFPNLIPGNGFTIRWSGFVEPYFSEDYTFHVKSDDGCRLWIGDSLLIDKWVAQSSTLHSGAIRVEGGAKIPIRLEYLEIGGGADISLQWSSPRTPKALVPKRQLYPISPYEPATVRGTVWHDQDYDQLIEPGEPLLKNTTVLLFDAVDSTLLATGFADALGKFKFSGLVAGAYSLRFVPPPASIDLVPFKHLDMAGQTGILQLGPLESLVWDVSFVTQPSSISGKCFHDENYNGAQDLGETGLQNITALLFAAADSSLLDVQFSGAQGQYAFNFLPAGSYFIQFNNALNGQDLAPGGSILANGISPVVLLGQSESRSLNAPFVYPPGKVTGRVWLDENANQFADIGENGLENATLLLYTTNAALMDAQSSQPNGSFLFDHVPPGHYYLQALTNAVPLALQPSFGINQIGQTLPFEVFKNEARVLEIGFKPQSTAAYSWQSGNDFQLFPNPVQGTLMLRWAEELGAPVQIVVADIAGHVLNRKTFPIPAGNSLAIDVRELEPGLYYLQVESPYGKLVRPFIKY